MSLTREQVETLLRPINPKRVLQAQGQSHVAAFDIKAHLNRIFGFGGWNKEVLRLELVHEYHTGEPPKQRGWATYLAVVRLTVKDSDGAVVSVHEDCATGSAHNQATVADAHDLACKNAVSYALKRCAAELGDQFGLSLYNRGMTSALVGKTLVMPDGTPEAQVDVEEHAPAPQTLGNDEREQPEESSGHGSPGTGDGPATAGEGPSPAEVCDRIRTLDSQAKADVKAYAASKGYKVTPVSLTGEGAADLAAWLDRREKAGAS